MSSQAPTPPPAPDAAPPPPAKARIRLRPDSGAPAEDAAEPSFAVSYGAARDMSLLQKNPLVPAGALLTGAVLMGGLFAFKRGNTRLSQQLMRARVLAQGATLCVLGASVASVGKAEPSARR